MVSQRPALAPALGTPDCGHSKSYTGHSSSQLLQWGSRTLPRNSNDARATESAPGSLRLCSARALSAPAEHRSRIGAGEDAILTAARAAITEDGAEVLVLWQPLTAAATARLAADLPVPLIEPASLSLRLAEAFLGLGLAQSRRTWPMPQVAKPDLIAALVAAGAEA